jgi:hypothetical protein
MSVIFSFGINKAIELLLFALKAISIHRQIRLNMTYFVYTLSLISLKAHSGVLV